MKRYSSLSGTLVEVLPNHTNQLLDRIEELLIENSALDSALKVVNRYLPPDAQEKVRSHIEDITFDSTLRELVRRRFADYRNQSPDNPTSPLLNEDFKEAGEDIVPISRKLPGLADLVYAERFRLSSPSPLSTGFLVPPAERAEVGKISGR